MSHSSCPNVVFIVADDLGYADLGCYGGRAPISPVLDKLAAKGAMFTQGYSNSPVCSPTRFALTTARYQYRLRGAADEPIPTRSRGSKILGLPPEHPTLPSLLKGAGYRTALMGKWHLGFPPAFGPRLSGYEAFFGPLAGGVDYFSHRDGAGIHDLWENEEKVEMEGYLTDLISTRACNWIEEGCAADAAQPFFLSVHYTAPHWPWEAREDIEVSRTIGDRILHLQGGSIHTYRRMVKQMDEGIGSIVATLDKLGLTEDTLVIFTSDNGGERFSDNWPLIGGKMDLTEGGIRVPWIAHWPKHIPAGSVSAQPCMTMDWSATVLHAAGVAADPAYPLDGVSLLGVLARPQATFDRPLHWRMNFRQQAALRAGDWKYLKVDENEYLFNLAIDERERANQRAVEPQRFESMRRQWLQWNETMPPVPPDATVGHAFDAKDMPHAF